MGGRGKGLKKKARVNVFVLKWMDKSIGDEPNKTWLRADASNVARYILPECQFLVSPLVKNIRFLQAGSSLFFFFHIQVQAFIASYIGLGWGRDIRCFYQA